MRENIIRSQPPDKQAAMAQWFENLMEGIERNLLTKNRDRYVNSAVLFLLYRDYMIYFSRFTQNLSMFRRDINDSLKGPNVNTSVSDMMTS